MLVCLSVNVNFCQEKSDCNCIDKESRLERTYSGMFSVTNGTAQCLCFIHHIIMQYNEEDVKVTAWSMRLVKKAHYLSWILLFFR